MLRNELVTTLSEHRGDLRTRGVVSLLIIGLPESDEVPPEQTIDFLVELRPPVDYDHWLEVRAFLSALLGRTVDLTIANHLHEGVQPYLDPTAILILRSEK